MEQSENNGSGLVVAPLLPQVFEYMEQIDHVWDLPDGELADLWRRANVGAFNDWLGEARDHALATWVGDLHPHRPHEAANAIVALARSGSVEAIGVLSQLEERTVSCMYDDMQSLEDYARRFGLEINAASYPTLRPLDFDRLTRLESLADLDRIPGRNVIRSRYATTLGALAEWCINVLRKLQ